MSDNLRGRAGYGSVLAGVVFLVLMNPVLAAKPPADPLTCSIDPDNGMADVGVPVTFTANTQGGKGNRAYSWTFSGPASPTSSTSQSQSVTYSAAGAFGITLHVTDRSGECTTSTTITVQNATNNPPVANDDSYDATDGQTLSVGNPGVLGNDADENPSTLTAALVSDTTKGNLVLDTDGSFTYDYTGTGPFPDIDTFTYRAEDDIGQVSAAATVTITVAEGGVTVGAPVARGDAYATPVGTPLNVMDSRVSGVLYNDFDTDPSTGENIGNEGLEAVLVSGPTNAADFNLNPDGSFSYTPNMVLGDNANDSFTYVATNGTNESAVTTVNINILSKQNDFKILMNYELGMHCTGFEFAYCCVLPPYNSILAQVVKPQKPGTPVTAADYPRLLEGDHSNVDGLGRPIVMRDAELDGNGNFKKYFLEYYHDAQPRLEGQGKTQTSTLISAVEGNSLFYTSTVYDSAQVVDQIDGKGPLVYGEYEGAFGIVQGDGDFDDPTDNYANGWLNHFYIYQDLEGTIPDGVTSLEADKIRLGVTGHVEYPANVGAALQPMGPVGAPGTDGAGLPCFTQSENDPNCTPDFDNVLTYSGDTGTVVYTQSKVLENLPIMLTSPHIWEALGLPLTPFEDSIDFFGDPGLVDEDSIRPYVAMKARLHEANCGADGQNCTQGDAVIGSNGHPVIGFGTAPIDIPNCERCHSVPAETNGQPNVNSPSYIRSDFQFPHGGTATLEEITDAEYQFWNAYYDIVPGVDSDWYSRLKGAAINMLALHDFDQGTAFTSNWPDGSITLPTDKAMFLQNTRLGKESVICQKCHADNVIAVVKSGYKDAAMTQLIKPITEAIHWRHRETSEGGNIAFADAAGRSGGCQGCHPAHRSDGVMDNYPITLGGGNAQAESDNRLAAGGCFVGRDVHSNPMKDIDGAETPAHLNAVGQWLSENVFHNQAGEAGIPDHDTRGLWCTNCHTQLGQEIWKAENCKDLINGDCIEDIRGAANLSELVSRINAVLGTSYNTQDAVNWLDPKDPLVTPLNPAVAVTDDLTHAIWDAAISDANVATIETRNGQPWGTTDADGDFSVRILDFCTTEDCVAAAQVVLDGEGNNGIAIAVPFSAATDGRDHWLSPGEPHCADCHASPYVEPSGANIGEKDFKPPFNYPRKASLMRYSTGHQGVTCQGCHESIHGLYPVTPTIDSTSYAQAAALNHDGSHGPLKCGTCHAVDADGIPTWIRKSNVFGGSLDEVTTWAHTYTENASPLTSTCLNCHQDRSNKMTEDKGKWLRHAFLGRIGRHTQDKVEIEVFGHVAGDPDTDGDGVADRTAQDVANTVCTACHSQSGGPDGDFLGQATCENLTWKQHLVQGRLAESVWEFISKDQNGGSTCGW